jgi:UPF0716 family protein affecting phage T7 exclusion
MFWTIIVVLAFIIVGASLGGVAGGRAAIKYYKQS